jgi:hypothetical protein
MLGALKKPTQIILALLLSSKIFYHLIWSQKINNNKEQSKLLQTKHE